MDVDEGPVELLEELREVSHDKVDQDYPFVPPMIPLFAVHDDDFYRLLEDYGEQALDPDVLQAVTDLMKQLPGLWAMAAEIQDGPQPSWLDGLGRGDPLPPQPLALSVALSHFSKTQEPMSCSSSNSIDWLMLFIIASAALSGKLLAIPTSSR